MSEAARSRGMRNSFDTTVDLPRIDTRADSGSPSRAWKGVSQ